LISGPDLGAAFGPASPPIRVIVGGLEKTRGIRGFLVSGLAGNRGNLSSLENKMTQKLLIPALAGVVTMMIFVWVINGLPKMIG